MKSETVERRCMEAAITFCVIVFIILVWHDRNNSRIDRYGEFDHEFVLRASGLLPRHPDRPV